MIKGEHGGMDQDFHSTEEELYNQLSNFIESEQWERAQEVLQKLLATSPESAFLHYQMGNANLQLAKFSGSEYHFKRAIALDPEDSDNFQGMALLEITRGRFPQAEEYCRKAIALNPTDSDHWITMGDLCRVGNDRQQALRCLERAQELDPGSTEVLRLRADISTLEGDPLSSNPDDQLENYRQVLARDPEDESALYSSGIIYLQEKNDYRKAQELFRAALRQNPTDRDYENALIRTYRKRDPVLRLLWLPLRCGFFIGAHLIILIPILYFFHSSGGRSSAEFMGCALLVFLVFWPITKLYELLTIAEVHKEMGSLTLSRHRFQKLHRLPYLARLAIFLVIILSFWSTVICLLWNPESRQFIISTTGKIVVFSFLALLGYFIFHSIRTRQSESKRARKNAVLFSNNDS